VATRERTAPPVAEVFTEAMARLVSGVAVVTVRRPDGTPGGLLVSSVCSYSVRPPSLLMSIGRESRSYRALLDAAEFGVHLLGAADCQVARVFAGRSDDKFAGLAWSWEETVPRLHATPVYLRCLRRRVFEHGDHAVVIGEVARGGLADGEPLVYYRRTLGWRLTSAGPAQSP
jgi:flavin reductase (DIM6/NTAB) family NADH-FMN oxidoreductase RutF